MTLKEFAKKQSGIVKNKGIKHAIQSAVGEIFRKSIGEPLIRRFSKDRISIKNGVAVRDIALYESEDVDQGYKRELCRAVVEHIESTDKVVTVGGGEGIVATFAAREGSTVEVYEASETMVGVLHETANLNKVEFNVNHAVVGSIHNVYGDFGNPEQIKTSKLEGDVLVLDCEGAEMDILPVGGFRTVIVETHPEFGAHTSDILDKMEGGFIYAKDRREGDILVSNNE